MQTVTAPGASARTFLIHMFSRGLDDNRYVVERYKSTFDGEIVRWPCKGKSKTGKHPIAAPARLPEHHLDLRQDRCGHVAGGRPTLDRRD